MELIKSYHLLYACIDLAFKNAFMAYREDLLNPEFEMLPSDWGRPHFVMPSEPPCLIGYLCKCSSMLTDAMHMKMYTLKEMILGFIKNNTLAADPINLTGLFSTEVFVLNFKNIVNAYEVQLLKKDFDERIFFRQLLEQQSNIGVRVSLFCDSGENGILESPIRREVLMARNGEMQVTKREFVGNRGTDITASIDRISSQKGNTIA
ncbi:hypothetical protein NQ317_005331 [Molorchus minor]|uniref:Uncharacterized protein n=1 Tax=Molorchus minor TaxID=1323400 RepID=A0ABQ9JFE8_9CUCU|nr:hypothetical protein NQ317_005331 [Molorchus minor]